MRRFVAVLAGLALLACTPEPPPAAPAPPTETAIADRSEAPTALPTTPASRARRPLQYVALGDSLASGMDAIDGGRSYADAYAALLRRRTQRKVQLTNLGVPGWTSTDLLDALRTSDQMRDALASADVVTLDIGGNDLIEVAVQVSGGACGGSDGLACLQRTREAFAQRWDDIVSELAALRRSPRVPVRTFTLYRPFATIRGVNVDALLAELDQRNAIIQASDSRLGVQVADVAGAFADAQSQDLIDEDGLHPTRVGHELIAEELGSLGG